MPEKHLGVAPLAAPTAALTSHGMRQRVRQALRWLATPPDTNYLYRPIEPSPYAL